MLEHLKKSSKLDRNTFSIKIQEGLELSRFDNFCWSAFLTIFSMATGKEKMATAARKIQKEGFVAASFLSGNWLNSHSDRHDHDHDNHQYDHDHHNDQDFSAPNRTFF